MNRPFGSAREAALAVLNDGAKLTRKGGAFLGQLVADPAQLSDRQAEWLALLLKQRGLPPLRIRGPR